MSAEITESEARWLDSLRDGHGPSGTVDPHDIRELVRLARRMAVVTIEEQDERDRRHDRYVAESLAKVVRFYLTPRDRRESKDAKDLVPTVHMLVREFVNGWAQ